MEGRVGVQRETERKREIGITSLYKAGVVDSDAADANLK